MKKLCLVSVFFVLIGFLAINAEEQEEIDFLLFLPNSADQFVNHQQAMVQLDSLAKYLTSKELIPGQIFVYGYAAFAVNDIDAGSLSRDRALFVISELQRRGVPQNLFSAAVGEGSVDLWGDNSDDEDRSPNRRVRVVLDGAIITPQTVKAAEPEIKITVKEEAPVIQESTTDESSSKFPWWLLLLLLLLLLAALLFLLLKKKKKAEPEKAAEPVIVPAAAIATSTVTVNLQEEIRFRAYELYLQRNGQSENEYEDWCTAVIQISAKYRADGYEVYRDGDWWAKKTTTTTR